MFCAKCGEKIEDNARFCTSCGTVVDSEPLQAPSQPVISQQPAPPQPPQYAPPPYVRPEPQPQIFYAQPQNAPPSYAPPKKKRHIGCFVVLFLFLAIVGAGLFVYAKFAWAPPRDLGIRYTQADFDSAMGKIGLQVDYKGMDSDELTQYIDDHQGEKLLLDTYNWQFSDYQEKQFKLTAEEATAFANEIAPLLTWFDDVQIKTYSDGHSAGSYKVHFDKIKDELIPDVADNIPKAVSDLLPDTFNLFTEGSFEIKENNIVVPDQLDRLEVGVVPLLPVIGDLSDSDRSAVYDYVERIYTQIPELMIHSLKINQSGDFEVSAYMPTKVTLTDK